MFNCYVTMKLFYSDRYYLRIIIMLFSNQLSVFLTDDCSWIIECIIILQLLYRPIYSWLQLNKYILRQAVPHYLRLLTILRFLVDKQILRLAVPHYLRLLTILRFLVDKKISSLAVPHYLRLFRIITMNYMFFL